MYELAICLPPPPVGRGGDGLWIKAQLLLEKGFPSLGSDVISLKIEENLPRTQNIASFGSPFMGH